MLMVELISTVSSISDGSIAAEDLMLSMWEEGTRTLSVLGALQRRDGITQRRMEMWLQEGWTGRAEVGIMRATTIGLQSQAQTVLTSFGQWFSIWSQELQLALSANSNGLRPGSSDPLLSSINIPARLSFWKTRMALDIDGFHSLVSEAYTEEMNKEVSDPPPPLRSGPPRGGGNAVGRVLVQQIGYPHKVPLPAALGLGGAPSGSPW